MMLKPAKRHITMSKATSLNQDCSRMKSDTISNVNNCFNVGKSNCNQRGWIPVTKRNGVSPSIPKGLSNNELNLMNRYEILTSSTNDNLHNVNENESEAPQRLRTNHNIRRDSVRNEKESNLDCKGHTLNVTFCSDSQGKLVQAKIESLSNNKIKAFGYVRPNADLTPRQLKHRTL